MMDRNIWDFQRDMTNRLFSINVVNLWLGKQLARYGEFWRGIGAQAIGWAFINIIIAVVGGRQARKKFDELADPNDDDIQIREGRRLQRILAINAPLNLVYMWGGYRLVRRHKDRVFMRGNGWGIVLQGVILLCFDTFHLRRITRILRSRR